MCNKFGLFLHRKMNMFCLSFYVHNKSGQTMIVTCSHDNGKTTSRDSHMTSHDVSSISGEDGVTERQSVRLMSRQKHKVFIFLRCFHLPHEVQNSANEVCLTHSNPKKLSCTHTLTLTHRHTFTHTHTHSPTWRCCTVTSWPRW